MMFFMLFSQDQDPDWQEQSACVLSKGSQVEQSFDYRKYIVEAVSLTQKVGDEEESILSKERYFRQQDLVFPQLSVWRHIYVLYHDTNASVRAQNLSRFMH